jgi:hypothetical protein
MIYIKVHKCASSTSSGVARRLAATYISDHDAASGTNGNTNEHLKLQASPVLPPGPPTIEVLWANHRHMPDTWPLMAKLEQRSFLWTVVRLPVGKCMSLFYMRQARSHSTPTKAAKLKFLQGGGCSNAVFDYMKRDNHDTVSGIVSAYSFIGITERYEESMVMLAFMLRVPLSRVLYLKSKDSHGGTDENHVVLIEHPPLAEEDKEVLEYALSRKFNESNALDYALYDAVSAEFNRRWSANKAELDRNLVTFRTMLSRAREVCKDPDPRSGYAGDMGVGYKCMDRLYPKHGEQ